MGLPLVGILSCMLGYKPLANPTSCEHALSSHCQAVLKQHTEGIRLPKQPTPKEGERAIGPPSGYQADPMPVHEQQCVGGARDTGPPLGYLAIPMLLHAQEFVQNTKRKGLWSRESSKAGSPGRQK